MRTFSDVFSKKKYVQGFFRTVPSLPFSLLFRSVLFLFRSVPFRSVPFCSQLFRFLYKDTDSPISF